MHLTRRCLGVGIAGCGALLAVSVGACERTPAVEVLAAVNGARAQARQCGGVSMSAAPPVVWSAVLAKAARHHSKDMADHELFSHQGSDGHGVGDRVHAAGGEWRAAAENIAGGPSSAAEVVSLWLSSPGHCANLMNPVFTEIGLACSTRDNSRYGRYWTLVLTRP
ncbi:MAG: CAP domain-containing protein [Hydrogenophaga sp.]|nr:CAP domain-containing protein [Hydrogenophaga sp.]